MIDNFRNPFLIFRNILRSSRSETTMIPKLTVSFLFPKFAGSKLVLVFHKHFCKIMIYLRFRNIYLIWKMSTTFYSMKVYVFLYVSLTFYHNTKVLYFVFFDCNFLSLKSTMRIISHEISIQLKQISIAVYLLEMRNLIHLPPL